MKTIFADDFEINIRADEDYGLHQADPGYRLEVIPKAQGIEFVSSEKISDICVAIAIEELKIALPISGAAELYEYCEDGNPEAIKAADYADDVVRHRLFEEIEIRLREDQIAAIEEKYKDREGDFRKSIKGWVRKFQP